ncbi:restriction endonuclease [Dawidia soli]|uniref:Restriction endonuclease n=1 Tax=Dawidia soli TaxID=2782352 RepID=A0AAP2GIZ9_9BACT|nr:restriction endonuclease [Dawidia soli]MBT1688866.1 restriction endonuclease [Dawidia soli]
MDWRGYEQVTKYIYETLGKATGVKIEGHGSSCKVKGKSGVYHQIDVLTSHSDGIHTYRTAIECKFWEDSINKDIVMKVAEIIEDAGINKGVIVSKKGFTTDGISFAKYKNIGLVELRELENRDREEFNLGMLNIKTELRRPEILGIMIDNVGENLRPEHTDTRQIIVRVKEGEEIPFENYLTTFKMELHKEAPDNVVEKYYELKGAELFTKGAKKSIKIRGFTLKGKLTIKDIDLKWDIVDEVWLIMNSLFDEKSFTISKMGAIQQSKPKNRPR